MLVKTELANGKMSIGSMADIPFAMQYRSVHECKITQSCPLQYFTTMSLIDTCALTPFALHRCPA